MSTPKREPRLRRYRVKWGRALLAVAVVAVLLALAIANAAVRANWTEVEDGVLWVESVDGLVAESVASNSPAAVAGIQRGDVLLAVNNEPIEKYEDVLRFLHSGVTGTRLNYTVLRVRDQQLYGLSLERLPGSSFPVHLALAAVGLFGLLVGAAVRVRRPGQQATLHFFWLTVAFFGVFAFSFSGRLDRLDWVFFWADEIAILLVAPLFMHFALVFPERSPGWVRNHLGAFVVPLIYMPAVALGGMQALTIFNADGGAGLTQAVERIWRFEHIYLVTCTLGGLTTMVVALRRVHSGTARRQLRWVVSGAVLGGVPFAVGYGVPYGLGFEAAEGMEFTAVPLGLIPLTFASAIVRYRLRDVEVIVKRSLVYTAAVVAMLVIYLALEGLASEVFLEESDDHNVIIALLATAVVVLLANPVKSAIHTMLDRVYYRDRFDHRRALVRFARDLNSDLDLRRLSKRLVHRVSATLDVERMVLFLVRDLTDDNLERNLKNDYQPIRWVGFDEMPPVLRRATSVGERMHGRYTVLLDDAANRRKCSPDDVSFWRSQELYYFVPCVAEEGPIAVMALGRKGTGEPLSSEDMALLAAVAGQVATALENGRLYGQLEDKAGELDRMRQFSDNIIESLNDGLVVLDLDDRVVRWNAGFERLYGVSRADAVGQSLDELFDKEFVERLRQARDDSASESALYRVPLSSRHPEKSRLLVNAATAPLSRPDGKVEGTMVFVENITARVQLEEQVQISEKMASIGLLAAGVAHEVNTPLTGISSFTQMLLDGADPEDPKTPLLEKIEQQTFRASKIVNGLLNLSRPGQPDSIGPVDVNMVITDVLGLLEHQFELSNVQVRRELSAPLPVVTGVEFKVQQVFLNLFLNARDAMETGGWLTVTSSFTNGSVVIEVTDTGAGIPAGILSRIYDPFFTTKAAGQGTGLGLSVTYGVVQEHHGTIECDSQAGRGTCFTLTFPKAVSQRTKASEAVR
jgi:two-component system NtrC family sensor kinase